MLLTPETFAKAKEVDASKYKRWAQLPVEEAMREIKADPEADILRTEISRASKKDRSHLLLFIETLIVRLEKPQRC